MAMCWHGRQFIHWCLQPSLHCNAVIKRNPKSERREFQKRRRDAWNVIGFWERRSRARCTKMCRSHCSCNPSAQPCGSCGLASALQKENEEATLRVPLKPSYEVPRRFARTGFSHSQPASRSVPKDLDQIRQSSSNTLRGFRCPDGLDLGRKRLWWRGSFAVNAFAVEWQKPAS